MTTPLFIGGLGPPELLLIAGVLILLFGASKLPKLARSMGSATGEFKKGREQVEDELDEIRDVGSGVTESNDETRAGTGTETETETTESADVDSEADREAERTGA